MEGEISLLLDLDVIKMLGQILSIHKTTMQSGHYIS